MRAQTSQSPTEKRPKKFTGKEDGRTHPLSYGKYLMVSMGKAPCLTKQQKSSWRDE